MGPYRQFINPKGSEEDAVRSAKWFVTVIAILAMMGAPFLNGQDTIFSYLQTMNGIYFIPIFAVVVVGMLHRKVPSLAANIALACGIIILTVDSVVLPLTGGSSISSILGINGFHFLGLVFWALVIFMLVFTKLAPRKEAWQIETNNPIDMTPWWGAPVVSVLLVIAVLGIYAYFI